MKISGLFLSTASDIWQLEMLLNPILSSKILERGLFYSSQGETHFPQPRYVEHDTLIWEYLNSSIHLAPYLEKKFRKIYEGEAYKFYRQR